MSATGRKKQGDKKRELLTIGWREWVALPGLGIDRIKAKVDTGARSSALHAYDCEKYHRAGKSWLRFKVHPVQRDSSQTVQARAEILDERVVRSSGGHVQLRWVVRAEAELHGQRFWIELTLTRRDAMGFRMLLGREAIRRRFLVNPGKSFLAGRPPRQGRVVRNTKKRVALRAKSKQKRRESQA